MNCRTCKANTMFRANMCFCCFEKRIETLMNDVRKLRRGNGMEKYRSVLIDMEIQKLLKMGQYIK